MLLPSQFHIISSRHQNYLNKSLKSYFIIISKRSYFNDITNYDTQQNC